jgi:flagellar basal body L-ring protein FlgH
MPLFGGSKPCGTYGPRAAGILSLLAVLSIALLAATAPPAVPTADPHRYLEDIKTSQPLQWKDAATEPRAWRAASRNLYDFTDALRRSKVGDVVEVKIMRDGQPVTASVKLEQRR